ncbi:GNAT family N-acetyltransferase [Micrococcaceae bacterium Sec5.1]
MARSFTPKSRAVILQEFVMLYSIAVVAARRGEGLGAALLSQLRELALTDEIKVIYGVCSADSAGFYEAEGYRRPGQAMHPSGPCPRGQGILLEGDSDPPP